MSASGSQSPLVDNDSDEDPFPPSKDTAGAQVDGAEDEDDDDDDEDAVPTARRKHVPSNTAPDEINGLDANGDAADEDDADQDLFGDDNGSIASDAPQKKARRALDDEDLDSGDDLSRSDRAPGSDIDPDEAAAAAAAQEELNFMDLELGRHAIPQPSDGELYLLKVPRFLSIGPDQFLPQTFQPPITDHHSKTTPSSTFNAYNTAMTTIRWRRSPSNPAKLQSNARVLRWSDGSLTLQLASEPTVQYLVPGNALAPPQITPAKPTPCSIQKPKPNMSTRYDPSKDSFTYLCAPHEAAQMMRVTNKFTCALKVQPASNAADDALERLQTSLAAAAAGASSVPGSGGASGVETMRITEDPELEKKRAETAEKEKMRAQRRRETQEAREREKHGRVLGRRGLGGAGLLSAGALEGDGDELGAGVPTRRAPRGTGAAARRQANRRGEIYSDDDSDYGHRGRTKEDEYDQEDDFLAPSDEEEEVDDDDDDDIDEGIDLSRSAGGKRNSGARSRGEGRRDRATTPSKRPADEDLDDAGGAATAGSPAARGKRRRVIDDEDDEDE